MRVSNVDRCDGYYDHISDMLVAMIYWQRKHGSTDILRLYMKWQTTMQDK